jgi:hypothetical protein
MNFNVILKQLIKIGAIYMELIDNMSELKENLSTLEKYMNSKDSSEREFYRKLIGNGICFVEYKKENKTIFAPSRFIGYKNNNMLNHINNDMKDGKETTPRINYILQQECKQDEECNYLYKLFCNQLGFTANAKGKFGVDRKYWTI